jgi:hypothetical protein
VQVNYIGRMWKIRQNVALAECTRVSKTAFFTVLNILSSRPRIQRGGHRGHLDRCGCKPAAHCPLPTILGYSSNANLSDPAAPAFGGMERKTTEGGNSQFFHLLV